MSYPTLDTQHNTEALALFTDHYRGKLNISNLLASYMGSIQTLESVFWDIINKFLLTNTPIGDQLNQLGKLVGAQRGVFNDAQYLQVIRLQIRTNRSQGLSEDIIQIATLAMNGGQAPYYVDQWGLAFIIECLNLPFPEVLAGLLPHARSVGTYGVLHYTTWTPGNDFGWNSRYVASPLASSGVWGSRYDSSVGGLWVAGAGV